MSIYGPYEGTLDNILLDVEKLLTQSEAESVKKFTEDMNDNDGGAANV